MDAPIAIVTRATYKPRNASYTEEEKATAIYRVKVLGWRRKRAAEALGCTLQSVCNWVGHDENEEPMHNYSHRPPDCDPAKQKELVEDVVGQKRKKGLAVSTVEFRDKLQKKVDETRDAAHLPRKKVSTRYARDFINKSQLKTGNAEIKSNAHEIAEDDPRHAASFAALTHHLHKSVPRGQFLNMDKTSFDYIKNKKENKSAVYTGERDQRFQVPTPKNCHKPQGNCSIPLYIVASDGGKIADVVYLIKDNAMKKDEIDTYSVPMLDVGNSAGSTAHLVFHGEFTSNTDVALAWVYRHIVVPFADQIRSGAGRDPSSFVSLNIDGDPRQLQVSTQDDFIGLFAQAHIIVGKSPASCTPIFQPLDAGKLFLAAKARFEKLIEAEKRLLNEEDCESLRQKFQEHRLKYPEKKLASGSPSGALGSHFKDVLICLPAVAVALREVPLHRIIQASFADTGISPFSPSNIRNKSTYRWTPAQEAQFDAAVPILSQKLGVNYELKESDFDECGLPANNKPKDGVSVHMRRALLLHGPPIVTALRQQAARSKKD